MRVLIQHHPSRADLLARVMQGLPPAGVEVVCDPDPEHRLSSAWRSQRACMEAAGLDRVLVLQDDAVPAHGLLAAAEAVAALHPDRLVSFFHGGAPPNIALQMQQAHERGVPLIELRLGGWVPTVALMWPPEAAADFLSWVDHDRRPKLPPGWRADDSLVGQWAKVKRRGALQTVPCLVEHPDDAPSLLGAKHREGRNKARVAAVLTADAEAWASCL